MNSNKDLIKNVIKKYCKAENVIVVMDFDHTITTFSSSTSIGVYSYYLGKEYKKRKDLIDRLVTKYDNKLIVKYLWKKKFELLKKYYNQDLLMKISENFEIRREFKEIIEYFIKHKINFIICSSGHKKLIDIILKNNKNFKL